MFRPVRFSVRTLVFVLIPSFCTEIHSQLLLNHLTEVENRRLRTNCEQNPAEQPELAGLSPNQNTLEPTT